MPSSKTYSPGKGQSHAIPTVLSIAGSDPSGGAGIQADLKTFTTTGVYGACVITALTAQNTLTVSASMSIPGKFVKQQLDAVLSDIKIDIIKLGMIPNSDICKTILPYLDDYPVVCDPVMISSSGCYLIDDSAVSSLMDYIIPKSDFITPNYNELKILYGSPVKDIKKAGYALMERFVTLSGIVLKGGHIDMDSNTVTDILIYRTDDRIKEIIRTNPRHHTKNTHGTGCTFASAFAAFLAKGHDAPTSFSKAVSFTNRLIYMSKDTAFGQGNGPLMHHAWRTDIKNIKGTPPCRI
jgi:hydroxymethylpyrimidine/phosphomethylpyrimidine kinase